MNTENNKKPEMPFTDADLSALLKTSPKNTLHSKNPLQTIKRNLIINMIFGIVIAAAYVIIIAKFNIWQVQVAIGITLLFTIWAMYTAFSEYNKLNADVSPDNPLLTELKRVHQSISEWMRVQKLVGIFIYPVSATGGFLLGGVLGSEKSVEEFMNKPVIWLTLLITLLILVPACHYLAKWMFKVSFGNLLSSIETNIRELESEI
ncbi:MAG: hypothetical protein IPM42_04450 [Saprospiraceae bacterium]|nr:hypothetical protein [Saprospiraceae bacterium]